MKAVSYSAHGGPEVLRLAEVPDPEPGPADVVVQVAATALNRLDIVQRAGWFTMPGFALPHIAGMDLAGVVVATGEQVTDVALGDRVVVDPSLAGVAEGSQLAGRGDLYGDLGIIGATVDGGYAELCLVPASHTYPVPDGMSLEAAAVFPTCWLTAAHALFEVGGLQQGETLLVHAAGSGVSSAAIQLACHAGAKVLATAGSATKCARAIELGAYASANNRTEDVAAWARSLSENKGVDMVLDHVGPALWEASLGSLTVGGRLVSCGNTTGDSVTIPSLGHLYHLGLQILGSDPYRPEEFGTVWETYCSGNFVAPIDSVLPLAEAAIAQERLLAGDYFGKILLRP